MVKFVDQISILSIFLVSFPEAVIVSTLGILSIGRFSYFNNKYNYVRIFLYAIVSAVSAYFVRRYVTSEIELTFVNLILICLSFIFIIRLKFYESVMATIFGFIILLVTEILCLIPTTTITGVKLDEVYINDLTRFLIFLPERVIQILLIKLSLHKKIKIIDLEYTNVKMKEYYIQLIVYIISIGTLMFLAVAMARLLVFGDANIMDSGNTIMFRINIYLSLFVTLVLTLAIRSTHEFYKNKATLSNNEFMQSLDYISTLVQEKNYSEAKNAIDNLKTHILNQ